MTACYFCLDSLVSWDAFHCWGGRSCMAEAKDYSYSQTPLLVGDLWVLAATIHIPSIPLIVECCFVCSGPSSAWYLELKKRIFSCRSQKESPFLRLILSEPRPCHFVRLPHGSGRLSFHRPTYLKLLMHYLRSWRFHWCHFVIDLASSTHRVFEFTIDSTSYIISFVSTLPRRWWPLVWRVPLLVWAFDAQLGGLDLARYSSTVIQARQLIDRYTF